MCIRYEFCCCCLKTAYFPKTVEVKIIVRKKMSIFGDPAIADNYYFKS